MIVSFYSSSYFSQFTWMSCPSTDLTTTFHPVSACTMPAVFVQGDVVIPGCVNIHAAARATCLVWRDSVEGL